MTPEKQRELWARQSPSTWLAGAAGRDRFDVVIRWGHDESKPQWLPCGIRWNALQMPEWMGLTVLDELLGSPTEGALGPVLHNTDEGHVYWLLPVEPDSGTAWLGIDPDLQLLGTGQHVACPTPEPETEPGPEQAVRWVHLPRVTGVLTPPTVLSLPLQQLLAQKAEL